MKRHMLLINWIPLQSLTAKYQCLKVRLSHSESNANFRRRSKDILDRWHRNTSWSLICRRTQGVVRVPDPLLGNTSKTILSTVQAGFSCFIDHCAYWRGKWVTPETNPVVVPDVVIGTNLINVLYTVACGFHAEQSRTVEWHLRNTHQCRFHRTW